MLRSDLYRQLEEFLTEDPSSCVRVKRVQRLMQDHENCFERSCFPGHITGSAWIVSRDREKVLLTHHRKLGRWLQLGGHADGEENIAQVAMREAMEESGLSGLSFWPSNELPRIIDVDVHRIPPYGHEPAHDHHDIRFLLIAGPDCRIQISEESNDLRWFSWEEAERLTGEESLLRLLRYSHRALHGESVSFPGGYR